MKRFIKKTLLGLFGGAFIVGSLGACSHRGPGGWQSGTEASPESRAHGRKDWLPVGPSPIWSVSPAPRRR